MTFDFSKKKGGIQIRNYIQTEWRNILANGTSYF